jgi:hypothetical protein
MNEEQTSVAGQGEVTNDGLVQKGPFSVSVQWREGSTEEEQATALEFVGTVVADSNTDGVIPEVIDVLTIKRT